MLNIIHETKDIIIVNKPAGQLSQGAKGFDLDLVSEVMTYNASQGKSAYAAIINRLDRPVSGLVLIARNKSAAAKYSTLMQKEGGFNKQYEALICGIFIISVISQKRTCLLFTLQNDCVIMQNSSFGRELL